MIFHIIKYCFVIHLFYFSQKSRIYSELVIANLRFSIVFHHEMLASSAMTGKK
jgi:hypothetical protein